MKAFRDVRAKVHEVYEKLDTKEAKKDVYIELLKLRGEVDQDQKVLFRDGEIEKRWRDCFD